MANELVIFQERIRKVWYEEQWWFSVVDVVGVLTDSTSPSKYWAAMKARIQTEGFIQVSTDCRQLKMRSSDGKSYKTDAATTETLLRIIQSIPSPKAEPFKRWLAKVGTERLEEEANPTLAEQRLMKLYQKRGYSDQWINQRMQSIHYRNGVTAEWLQRGASEDKEVAILTDTINVDALDVTIEEHRAIKHLKPKDNLRDSDTILELAVIGLAEATATTLHQKRDTQGFHALQQDCHDAGKVARDARLQVEALTGEPVVSSVNYKQLRQERQQELQPPLFEMTEE